MRKTVAIFLTAIAIYAIGIFSCYEFYKPKASDTIQPSHQIAKTIQTQNKQSQTQFKKLQQDKFSLQKKILALKTNLQKQDVRVRQLEQNIGDLSYQILDNEQSDTTCLQLAWYTDSVMQVYHVKDSNYQLQTIYTDSLLCKQDSTIQLLQNTNIFLNQELDTLLQSNIVLQKDLKKANKYLVFRKVSNRILQGGMLAIMSVLGYMQLKNLN